VLQDSEFYCSHFLKYLNRNAYLLFIICSFKKLVFYSLTPLKVVKKALSGYVAVMAEILESAFVQAVGTAGLEPATSAM
jgi:hypothetical protein